MHQATTLGGFAAPQDPGGDVLARIGASVARLGRRPQDLFAQLDADRDGRLTRHELEPTLRSLQPDISQQQLDVLFRRFDRDANGQVDLGEFCAALGSGPAPAAGPAESQDVLARIASSVARLGRRPEDLFRQLDSNNDGRLSRAELEPTLRSLQPDLSPHQLDAIFRRFDRDGNGQVELSEFCAALGAPAATVQQAPSLQPAATVFGQSATSQSSLEQDILSRISNSVARLGRRPEDLFRQLDANNDGRLARHELEPTLRSLQPDLSPPQLDAVFLRFDRDGSGQVDVGEFCAALGHPGAQQTLGQQPADQQRDVLSRIANSVARLGRRPEDLFRQLDSNNDGRLGRHELEPTLRSLQPDLTMQQLDALFRRFDRDGNGQVELNEFCLALQNPASASAQEPAPPVGQAQDVLARIAASVARLGRQPQELFFQLDANRDGRLTRGELEPTLRSLQPDLTAQQLDDVFRRFDRDGNGQVDLQEFCGALAEASGASARQQPGSAVLSAQAQQVLARIAGSIARLGRRPDELFAQLDTNRAGRLTRRELEPTLRSLQPDLTAQQLDDIFRRFDRDGNSQVELHEFNRALHDAAAPAPPAPGGATPVADELLARIAASVARLGRRPDELFSQLDSNRDGRLTRAELEPTLRSLQPDLAAHQMDSVFRRFDRDGNGEVELHEFCNALRDATARQRPQDDFVRDLLARISTSLERLGSQPRRLFSQLDADRSGRLTRPELEPTLRRLQPDATRQQLDAVFHYFDRDGSKEVDLEEFISALQRAARSAQAAAAPPPPPSTRSPEDTAAAQTAAARYQARHAQRGEGPLTLVVQQEDLLGGSALAIGARAAEGVPRQRGAHRGDVYVQNPRDGSRFRSVSGDRVRRMFEAGAERGGSSSSKSSRGSAFAAASEAATRAAAAQSALVRMDPDVRLLLPLESAADAEVLELLKRSREAEATADLAFFTCQGLAAGLGVSAGALAYGADSVEGAAKLATVMAFVSPLFNTLAMTLAQIALVGSVCQAARDAQAVRALQEDGGGGQANQAESDGELRSERVAWRQTVLSSLRAFVNLGLFTCSLLGGRSDAYLGVAATGDEPSRSSFYYYYYYYDDSPTTTTTAAGKGLLAAPEEWSAESTRDLLAARCCLSLLALALHALSISQRRRR